MAEYHVYRRSTEDGTYFEEAFTRTYPAAFRRYLRAVYDAIKAASLLDRPAGVDAMKLAEAGRHDITIGAQIVRLRRRA